MNSEVTNIRSAASREIARLRSGGSARAHEKAKAQNKLFARERLADSLLGVFLGALNGYLIIGTLWWFLIESNYPFPKYITKPTPDPAIIAYLPPDLLGIPVIFFAIAVAFLFVIVVFI